MLISFRVITGNSPHTESIHILDDDSLLNIFHLYRPAILDGDDDDGLRMLGGRTWRRERWWYNLAQVCQRWRNLILGSTSYLGLCLVCTHGTPVADMLAHSPHLPLIIDYANIKWDITAKDEEGIILALAQRDRVRRIRFRMPVQKLQKLIMAIEEEYPVLEHLILIPPIARSTTLMLPETLQAPHLHHLVLINFIPIMGSRLLVTAVGLVTLSLIAGHPSSHCHFHPKILLRWLTFMPRLETLLIGHLSFPVPNSDVEKQLMSITTHITLPSLRRFEFRGGSAYMEEVVRWMTAPRLEKVNIWFSKELIFSVPRLLQFIDTAENLRFASAKFKFSMDKVHVEVYPGEAETDALSMIVCCRHLDRQVSSAAQIFNSPSQTFSTVEHLTLEHEVHSLSSEEHNEVDRTEWHKLLRSFRNVKTLRVDAGLVKELSRCLRLDDGEHPLELLPELQELRCSGSGNTGDAFTPFIDARKNAGSAVNLVCDL